MMIVADTAKSSTGLDELNGALKGPCAQLGLEVVAQHETLYRYMHRV